jgi:hypothetical protein
MRRPPIARGKHIMNRAIEQTTKSCGPEAVAGTRFAVAAWVRAARERDGDHVVVSRGKDGWGFFRLYIQRRFGLLRFHCDNMGDYGCGVVDDGQWHHVAVSCEGRALTFYRDGLALYTFDVPGGPDASDAAVTVGALQDGTQRLNGAVDDLRFFDRPLAATDVARIVSEHPHPNPCAPRTSRVPSAPLYEDPLFNSAKDGCVVWNRVERNWCFIYMQIRNGVREPGAALHHGTTLGAASSADGLTWTYRGTLRGLEWEPGCNTFWAPDIVWSGGRYHAVIAYVHGIQPNWQGDRLLLHYVSDDLMNWKLLGPIEGLGAARTLDGCLYRLPDGMWGLWYKDESRNLTCFAEGDDEFRFRPVGPFDPPAAAVEGPDVFRWKGSYWLLADDCGTRNGLRVYRSADCRRWERRANILKESGARPLDIGPAHHPEVIVNGGEAFVFYWVDPDPPPREDAAQNCYLQVARLTLADGELGCDRNAEFDLRLPEGPGEG